MDRIRIPTHAGCIVFRQEGDGMHFLVISSSNGEHWVLPKGHIEKGEALEETAMRELAEEAGMSGEIVRPLSLRSHVRGSGERSVVQYYLVRATAEVPPKEKRTVRWETGEAALALLSFEDGRAALQEAIDAVEAGP